MGITHTLLHTLLHTLAHTLEGVLHSLCYTRALLQHTLSPHPGKTALMVAVQAGSAGAAAALLAAGVDAWRGDIRGNTALHTAAWQVRIRTS